MSLLRGCIGVMMGLMAVGAEGSPAARPRHPQTPQTPTMGVSVPGYKANFTSPPEFTLNSNASFTYTVELDAQHQSVSDISIILLQTSAIGRVEIGDSNTYKVADVQRDICLYKNDNSDCPGNSTKIQGNTNIPVTTKTGFKKGHADTQYGLGNLFFCFAKQGSPDICSYYSSVFNIALLPPSPDSGQATISSSILAGTEPNPNNTITVTATSTDVIELLQPTLTVTNDATAVPSLGSSPSTTAGSTSIVSVTASSSSAPTRIPTTAASAVNKSSLSTGAKIGIALGALAFVCLLLLAALFCLRKKHSKRNQTRSQPEQVMLTRDMHTDSFSRNLMMMEKERNPSSTIIPDPDTPLETSPSTSLPIQRHSALTPYEPVPSAPYNGPVGPGPGTGAGIAASSNIPKRKPTTATILSTVSRATSRSTSNEAISPRSVSQPTNSSSSRSGETPSSAFEAYHDVPIYGDARHVPQVFTSDSRGERGLVGGSASPFLGEEMAGMSPEEVARLEEEERRIDAAIAAAEGR